jgi:hypothetical protein
MAEVVGSIVLAIIGFFVTAVVAGISSVIRAHVRDKNYEFLHAVALDAVHAAEQGHIAGIIKNKKESAMRLAVETLSANGVKVTINQLDAAIEAAVLRGLHTGGKTADGAVDSLDK